MESRRNRSVAGGIRIIALALLAATGSAAPADEGDHGRTVTVSVEVDPSSGTGLTYHWRSTDGHIVDQNSPTTTWTLPVGPGLHFAYVHVANGIGGHTVRRIAVNTDNASWAGASVGTHGVGMQPPAAVAQSGDYLRTFIVGNLVPENGHEAYIPNVKAFLSDPVSGAVVTTTVTSNARGEVVFAGVPLSSPGDPQNPSYYGVYYDLHCSVNGAAPGYCGQVVMLDTATPNYFANGVGFANIVGSLLLNDMTPCGAQDELFGIHSSPKAILLGPPKKSGGAPSVLATAAVNEFGDFALPMNSAATGVQLRCEGAAPVPANASLSSILAGDAGQTVLSGPGVPIITAMTAVANWSGQPIGTFLPPPTGIAPDKLFASNINPRSDAYLGEKGIDSRLGACRYYEAIGAVQSCDGKGNFVGTALTYDAWQRNQKIGPYVTSGTPQYQAAFVNHTDLELTRVHTSVSYGSGNTTAVVCNHLGPPINTPDDLINTSQTNVDTAIVNAVNNKNLVACVAMDYQVWPGVNGDQPFTRFFIFGPSGELLPSINLDGRAEKFVPGTCLVCHGGDHYQGRFPSDGSGFANVGGRFLPYDAGNFDFLSSTAAASTGLKLQESDLQEPIYNLNQNVLQAGPTVAEQELIAGWYTNGHTLDTNYIPYSWKHPVGTGPLQTYEDFYTHVVARTCRTCHVAMINPYNFDHEYNLDEADASLGGNYSASAMFEDPVTELERSVCGGQMTHSGYQRLWMMPNSLVTFNRFYASSGTSNDLTAYFYNYLTVSGNGTICGGVPVP